MADDTQNTDTGEDAKFKKFMKSVDLPSEQDLAKQDEAYTKKLEEVKKPFTEKSNELMKQMDAVNKSMEGFKPPPKASLEKVPEAPDTKMQDPMKAMGSVGSVIALLGSLRTRAPMTAALNAAAESIKGYHKGDVEAANQEREKWKDNMEKALRNNQEELQKYTEALQESNWDMQKAQAKFHALSAQFQDNNMQSAQAAGDVQAQYALLKGRMQSHEKLVEFYMKHEENEQRIAAQAQTHADAQQLHKDNQSRVAEQWLVGQIDRSQELKGYRETIRKINDIESNLVPGQEMGKEVRSELTKFLTGARAGKWAEMDPAHGMIIERITKRIEQGVTGKMNDDEVQLIKSFLDNEKASNSAGIESERRRYAPLAKGRMDENTFNGYFDEMKQGNTPIASGGVGLSGQNMGDAQKALDAALGR